MKELVMILAGGAGGRMELLTERRAKPALPFAGVYRLIDFPLSNCVHSGISDVWVVQQYEPQSLNDHLGNGRPWDLDRTYGGLRLLVPQQGSTESGWHSGNADSLYKNRAFIREFDPDVLLVCSADQVYTLDYREVLACHRDHGADVTIVTTTVVATEASRLATVELSPEGRVSGLEYKPDEPRTDLVCAEVFAYRPRTLLDVLEQLASEHGEGDDLPEDYGESLLPTLIEGGGAWEYRLGGYWRDVGTVESYWSAHVQLAAGTDGPTLDDPCWPILTHAPQRPPARIHGGARIDSSLVAPGCSVAGSVVSSVLGPGVTVAEGAVVRHAVLFEDCVVEAGARVDAAVVDAHARIGEGARVGAEEAGGGAEEAGGDGIVLVGREAVVPPSARLEPGDRFRSRHPHPS